MGAAQMTLRWTRMQEVPPLAAMEATSVTPGTWQEPTSTALGSLTTSRLRLPVACP